MRLSQGFWQTYKETPAEAEIPSHQLMLRAGLIHKSAAGIYNYLPLGYRVVRKVEQIVREEMDKAGCLELLMTVVTPGDLWQESGRWDVMGGEMLKFKDKADRDLCISPTNEEAITDIFRKTIKSYKQLPVTLYQINTKFRDEIRPRFGLMRGREFTMKDAYSFHMDKACLDKVYDDLFKAYCNVFDRLGFEYSAVEADAGNMGSSDSKTHEFQVIANTGEDEIIYCPETGYAANSEKAQTKRANVDFDFNDQELKEVETKGKSTIADVCDFLGKPQSQSIKSLVYTAIQGEEEFEVLVLLVGDDELNEVKLKNHLGVDHITPATDSKLLEYGLVKGYIGPLDIKKEIMILFDEAIDPKAYYTVGAQKEDYHLTGYQVAKEFEEATFVDLRLAKEGDLTIEGSKPVLVKRGIEVGHIFQLGDKYTKAMGVTVLGNDGKTQTPLMGCYGLGITRVVAAAIEQCHDDKGIIWPKEIAPYQVYFATIAKSEEFKAQADDVYKKLTDAGFEVIYDDRKAGAGFKFKDADLLGLPVRVVMGERDFKESGEFEVVDRKTGDKQKVKIDGLVEKIKELLA
ncbi:MAG: proline--tRNA ligase [Oligoflexia bacterium]|nr:proline--tRNA ligase [Oligoflexia bacterium]